MSKLYVVVKVLPYMKFDPRRDVIGTFFNTSVPFVFNRFDPANKKAEKLRKKGVDAFVCEFPFNPLDKRLESMKARLKSDAEYIKDLEDEIDRLERIVSGEDE